MTKSLRRIAVIGIGVGCGLPFVAVPGEARTLAGAAVTKGSVIGGHALRHSSPYPGDRPRSGPHGQHGQHGQHNPARNADTRRDLGAVQRVTDADLRRAAEHVQRGVDADIRRTTDLELRPGVGRRRNSGPDGGVRPGAEGGRGSVGEGGRVGPPADARVDGTAQAGDGRRGTVPAQVGDGRRDTVPAQVREGRGAVPGQAGDGRRGAVPADEAIVAGHETAGEFDETGVAEVRPLVLRPGDRGPEVTRLQRRLHARHYYFGKINGRYDEQTKFAVWALQKTHGMAVKGLVGPREFAALERPVRRRPLVPTGGANRVEVNLTRQLLTVYRNRRPVLYSHISSGAEINYCHKGHCGNAVTPVGSFRVTTRAPGWTTGPLGSMFNSLYFVGGIALHGSTKVPLRPASHGCVRLPLSTSKRLYEIVNIGDPVYVRGKIQKRR